MSVKIAILDLYNGVANQGMRGFHDILNRYKTQHLVDLSVEVFDVRGKLEVPDTDFDIYISSGGPGSPLESEGSDWEEKYFNLIDELETINKNPERTDKKYVFFVCHSFQLLCRKYKLGKITKRKSTSFGIFPIHKTEAGHFESLLNDLEEPFFAVDSRDWQVIEPDFEKFDVMGARLLALEKERPHVDLERCMMAIRFDDYFFGTQFHPEADPVGMKKYLMDEEKKAQVIENHGEDKYFEMMQFLDDPDKLERTQGTLIPSFIYQAINALQEA